MLVGIDYSINSPGICIETTKENGEPFYNYFTIQKKENKCLRKLNMLNDVQTITIEKEGATEFEFIDKQTNSIIQFIEQIMELHKEKELFVAMEDFIYYSQQSSLIDIVQATTVLRYKIIQKWGEGVLNKYSPTMVKKVFTGNGKATKDDMLTQFNKLNMKNPFAQWCQGLSKAHKPEEDFIDSFAVLYTMKQELEEIEIERE